MELNGIEPLSTILMVDAHPNELLRVHQWYVVYHKKLTLSNLFYKKSNFRQNLTGYRFIFQVKTEPLIRPPSQPTLFLSY